MVSGINKIKEITMKVDFYFRHLLVIILITSALQNTAFAQDPVMYWDFETISNRSAIEKPTNIADTIEGNFKTAEGAKGQGLRLDGFTTRVLRDSKDFPKPGGELTIEAWVSLGEYPLNWCPVITTESNEVKGYRLMIGPYGQVSFETAISEQWVTCTSANSSVPLREWVHITCVYKAKDEMVLYLNGEPVSRLPISGTLSFPAKSRAIIGMVAAPERPSNTIRTWGTVPTFFGLSGIIDEIKIFDQALAEDQVGSSFSDIRPPSPDIKPHKLPVIKDDPGRFGAFYTRLEYYPEWDTLWPVDQDPDIVVCFEDNPVRLIFWRGIRYGPCWVSENQNWMTDQSLETWGTGKTDIEGCFEHMQDRHCRFSHVRIIENTDARVVVHWRYAPVSAYDNTWLPDPKTGWECWVDEYYYIYPDGSAIRKVSWNKGTTGRALQLQESLPLTQPGQNREDVGENKYVTVADYDYNTNAVTVDPPEKPAGWKDDYTIQQYNFKSENKPFICFEPGNYMWIRWIGGGYNHFPVNQARSDGRWALTTDRPTHFMSSPCSDPVVHEEGNRLFWSALYGMNTMSMADLITFGRSWAYAPRINVESKAYANDGYDMAQRCYSITNTLKDADKLEIKIDASSKSPTINPAFIIRNWNSDTAKVLVNGKLEAKARIGINHELSGDKLVIFIPVSLEAPANITILP
jgi:hypothetical protein